MLLLAPGVGMTHFVDVMSMNTGYINCDCGAEVSFGGTDDRAECECGRKYAITVTELNATVCDR